MWIVFIFASLFSNTGYSILVRRTFGRMKIDPIFIAALMATAVALPGMPGIFIADIDWSVYDLRLILVLIASVACAMAFHFVNAKALELTEASVFSIYYNFQIGFATFMGVGLLGEPFVLLRIIGGALVFVAGLVLSGGKVAARPSGIFFSILTALLIAGITAFDKFMIDEIGLAAYVFPSKIIAAAAMWTVVFLGKKPVSTEFLKSRWCVILMGFRCVAAYGIMLALSLGAFMSVTTYVSALTCVTTPVAAFFILKETGSPVRKAVSVAIALVSITFIFIATK